jgi:hypothetical protein
MMRGIVWKEWRENRWKYLTLWVVFNVPILALTVLLGLSRQARTPFADLDNATFMKYLPLSLLASPALTSVFLFATGFIGVATFLPEVESNTIFFAFEQPVARWRYAVAKVANGGAHVVVAAMVASLLSPAVVYAMILGSGKVTMAATWPAFGTVILGALRAGIWCGLVSAVAYAGCALIGSAVPRWWLATPVAFGFILLLANLAMGENRFFNGEGFFDLGLDEGPGTQNISASFGNWNWLTVTGAFSPPKHFGNWHVLPALTPVVLLCLFAAGTAWVFDRKELK